MRIQIHKGDGRHTLRCFRADGTSTQADTGPGLPGHDLAHYVAEHTLGLTGGFFGAIAAGRSIRELSDPAVIPTLGEQSMIAEVLAGAVGSLATGACTPEDFIPMVEAQLGRLPAGLTAASIPTMHTRMDELMAKWNGLPIGESLLLDWPA